MISSHSRKNTCHKFLRLLKEGIAFRKGGLLYEDFFIQGYLYRSAIGSKRRCTASLLATLVSAPVARVKASSPPVEKTNRSKTTDVQIL
jgi:hypothetical protein